MYTYSGSASITHAWLCWWLDVSPAGKSSSLTVNDNQQHGPVGTKLSGDWQWEVGHRIVCDSDIIIFNVLPMLRDPAAPYYLVIFTHIDNVRSLSEIWSTSSSAFEIFSCVCEVQARSMRRCKLQNANEVSMRLWSSKKYEDRWCTGPPFWPHNSNLHMQLKSVNVIEVPTISPSDPAEWGTHSRLLNLNRRTKRCHYYVV